VSNDKKPMPQSRMVVLRSFSDDWTFEFFTDHRSSKVNEIKSNPTISALFWDPSKRIQVRIEAVAHLHNLDEIAEDRWGNVQGDAQKAYTSVPAPGTPVEAPEDAHVWPASLSLDYFCVISCTAVRISALQLSGVEHRAFECHRAAGSGAWEKTWITP
jgi:hypothetical protein